MKHLKKFLAVALVCVMALTVLTGCGKSTKDYQSELSGKLSQTQGVAMSDDLNKAASQIGNVVKSVFKLSNANKDQDKLADEILQQIEKIDIDENTKVAYSITVSLMGVKETQNIGFGNEESSSQAGAVDFFISEIQKQNQTSEPVTKVGVATCTVLGFVDVVILVAQ